MTIVLRGRLGRSARATAFLAATLLLLSAGGCRRSPAGPEALPISSSFLTNDEGWSVVGDGNMFYSPTGGNPGNTGYIFAIDRVEGDNFYFVAPARYHGNMSAAYGRYLTFDLVWVETAPSEPKVLGSDIIMTGGGLTVTTNLASPPNNTWTPYAIPLDPSGGWVRQGTQTPATAAEIQTVLGSLQQLRIRGEFRGGPEQGGLDNVRFGATP
jgi:hypothetical protein